MRSGAALLLLAVLVRTASAHTADDRHPTPAVTKNVITDVLLDVSPIR